MKLGAVANTTAYEFYRLNITANNGGTGSSVAEFGLHFAPPSPGVLAPEQLLVPEITTVGNTVTLRALSAVGRIYQLQRPHARDMAGSWSD